MLADLYHADNPCGTATVGSSEVSVPALPYLSRRISISIQSPSHPPCALCISAKKFGYVDAERSPLDCTVQADFQLLCHSCLADCLWKPMQPCRALCSTNDGICVSAMHKHQKCLSAGDPAGRPGLQAALAGEAQGGRHQGGSHPQHRLQLSSACENPSSQSLVCKGLYWALYLFISGEAFGCSPVIPEESGHPIANSGRARS